MSLQKPTYVLRKSWGSQNGQSHIDDNDTTNDILISFCACVTSPRSDWSILLELLTSRISSNQADGKRDDHLLKSEVTIFKNDDEDDDEKMVIVDDDDAYSAVGFCQVFIEEEKEVEGSGGCSKSKDHTVVERNRASRKDNTIEAREKAPLENGGGTTAPINKKLQVLSCMHCAYKTSKFNKLKSHIRKHCCKIHDCRCFNASGALQQHPETPFTCTFCNYRFMSASGLARHRKRMHSNDNPFSCQLCEFSSSSSAQLKKHAQTHAGENRFRCEFCDFACDYSGDLKQHLTTHTGVEPFTCDRCDFETWEVDELDKHRPTHYKKPINCTLNYLCQFCDYQGSDSADLRNHIETHADKYPYSCHWSGCLYRSDRPASLQAHLTSHSLFSYKHNSCKFTSRGDLIIHTKTHTITPKRHLRIQSETKQVTPVCCEYCGHKCSDSDDLKKHLQINSCNKLFTCDFCDYRGELFVDLENHLDEHSDILYQL
ncbi:hypothetical protein LSTR_LSTR013136 [Laodelphax striatellus]|uniref:C2H2-type domain-containing protein n=1 Tax=Laodelphax striatellus TaxID=195883 RepID=A0A482XFE6_LAOST|nr:hypothetical protein LSTR_LSTR013136 [Laodelphax striatellus]